jgi:DNA-binding NarL/FixJ family response regulator
MKTILLIGGDHDLSSDMAELMTYAGYQVLGTPTTTQESAALARRLQPDLMLVLSTVGLDYADGLETVRLLLRTAPAARMIVWSARDSSIYIERLLAVGVSAFVPKSTVYSDLLQVVHRVAEGETPGYNASQARA